MISPKKLNVEHGASSDLAPAIKNGALKVLNMAPNNWSDCWAHTWRATGNHKGKLRDVDNYDAIITDLRLPVVAHGPFPRSTMG